MADGNRDSKLSESETLRIRIAAVLDEHYPILNSWDGQPSDLCECGMPRNHVIDILLGVVSRRKCRFWRHAWKYIGDPAVLDNTAEKFSTLLRYRCLHCDKTKDV